MEATEKLLRCFGFHPLCSARHREWLGSLGIDPELVQFELWVPGKLAQKLLTPEPEDALPSRKQEKQMHICMLDFMSGIK